MASLEKYLEIWGIENDNYIFQDGSMGTAFEVQGLSLESTSDEEMNSLKYRLNTFLNTLPEKISLQFVFDVVKDYAPTNEHEALAKENANLAASELTQARLKKIRTQIDGNLIPAYKLYLFLRKESHLSRLKVRGLTGKSQKFAEMADLQYKIEKSELERVASQVESSLKSLGLSVAKLTEEKLLSLLDEQWNPATLRKFSASEQTPDDLRATLCRTDVEINSTSFKIGDCHHRVVSLKSLPEHTFSGMSSTLKVMPIGSRTFLTIEVPNQISEIENLKKDRRIAWAMAKGKKAGVADLESEAKLAELEVLLEEMIASGEKIFRVSLNTVVNGENAAEARDLSSQVLSAYSEINGSVAMEETFAAFPVFAELSLPNARSRERARKIKTSNLSDFLPLFTPWEGMQKAKVLLKNAASGSLFKFDPFDVSLPNFNQLVSGGSGAGKSYLTNYLLLQNLSDNPYIYFVDIGGSYRKLVENLGGANIPIKLESGLALNPFDLAAGETVPTDHKVKFLVGLVELMTKEEEFERLPKLVRSEIEIAIKKVYERIERPRLSDLKEQLSSHEDVDLRKISKIMSSWCGDSAYGKFLDAPSNISLDSKLTAFDLKGLEQFQDLQVVALYIITDLICRKIAEHKSSRKFIVFDECWQLLKDDAAVNFIEKSFRAFRKENASAIAISQDIDDFAKSKISSAILPNCSVKWILMQPQVDGKRLTEVLNFNENEIATVKSLSQSKGEFSETYLITKDKKAHLRIESTSLEYWIATTDPPDLNAIEAFEKEHTEFPLIDVLKALSKRYPKGVSASAPSMGGAA